MTEWTIEDVAARFEEAASTGRRLPPVRVQGYFNCWPAFVRTRVGRPSRGRAGVPPFPPSPVAIERMLEIDALGAVAGGRATSPRLDAGQALRVA